MRGMLLLPTRDWPVLGIYTQYAPPTCSLDSDTRFSPSSLLPMSSITAGVQAEPRPHCACAESLGINLSILMVTYDCQDHKVEAKGFTNSKDRTRISLYCILSHQNKIPTQTDHVQRSVKLVKGTDNTYSNKPGQLFGQTPTYPSLNGLRASSATYTPIPRVSCAMLVCPKIRNFFCMRLAEKQNQKPEVLPSLTLPLWTSERKKLISVHCRQSCESKHLFVIVLQSFNHTPTSPHHTNTNDYSIDQSKAPSTSATSNSVPSG